MEESIKNTQYGIHNQRKLVTIHTREIDRNIARNNIKKQGYHQINKDPYQNDNKRSGKSLFARRWRDYVY